MPYSTSAESPWVYSGYSSDEEEMSEYEYADPYEDEDNWSYSPPPPCDGAEHQICVPPAWGESIPGIPLRCRCILRFKDNQHHAIRCTECRNAPGCCACIWGYMRSHYNSGCLLCRHGDPGDMNPLAITQTVEIDSRSRDLRKINRRGRSVVRGGGAIITGRGRGRFRGRGVTFGLEPARPSRGERDRGRRGCRAGRRRGGRGVTMEEEQEDQPER